MKPLEVWTCQRAENLKKKLSKIPKNNYAAKMVSAARRQIIGGGGGGAPINKSRRRRRRSQIVGGGGAARPEHSSSVGASVCRATGNSHSGNSGNSRDLRDPEFPLGIPGNFLISLKFRRSNCKINVKQKVTKFKLN